MYASSLMLWHNIILDPQIAAAFCLGMLFSSGPDTAPPCRPCKHPLTQGCRRRRSPRSQVTYSDRFIPSRAASSRLNFSVFDRETATSEPQKPPEKDVRSIYDVLTSSQLLATAAAKPTPPRSAQQC